jgi:hypothetical protein
VAAKDKRLWPMIAGWTVLLIVTGWLALASWLDSGGAWWVPVMFGMCAFVCAGNLMAWAIRYRRGRDQAA